MSTLSMIVSPEKGPKNRHVTLWKVYTTHSTYERNRWSSDFGLLRTCPSSCVVSSEAALTAAGTASHETNSCQQNSMINEMT
jgi:hypothetical protein